MKICVVGGAGYVGLITGLGLAEIGHSVINVDVDDGRIDRLRNGHSPIYEEGVESLLQRNKDAGRLSFSTDLGLAVESSEVVFIAVGTPASANGEADLSQVIQVAEELAKHLDAYRVIVIKSTVPVGGVELVRGILGGERQEGEEFDLVVNPEFLREGKGLRDFFYPDRIVVGASSDRGMGAMRALYEPIIAGRVSWNGDGADHEPKGPVPVVETSLASAQMIKYASNAFLATRLSFINEMAWLCEKVGADINDVASGMGYDPRIGHAYLRAGLGFGGPCLEKDLRALIKIAEANSYEPLLLRTVLERNERQVEAVIAKLRQLVGHLLYRRVVAVFGLAFKAGTDDVRNSMALRLIERLESEGAHVRAHDPVANAEASLSRPHIEYCDDPYEAARQADAIIIATEWPQFAELDYGRLKGRMALPYVVDARNVLDASAMRTLGFAYVGIGVST